MAEYRNAASLFLAESNSNAKTARSQIKIFSGTKPSNTSPVPNATPTPRPFVNNQSTPASGQHQTTPFSASGQKKVKRWQKLKFPMMR